MPRPVNPRITGIGDFFAMEMLFLSASTPGKAAAD
jgi:hypothetical protein